MPSQNIGDPNSKFVALRGLERGNTFWTTNTPGEDATKLDDGTVAYEVLKYLHSKEEAIEFWKSYYQDPFEG